MIYRLTNIENDDFIAGLLKELEYEIRNGDYEKIMSSEMVKSSNNTKGIEIQELIIHIVDWYNANGQILENVLTGITVAGVYDVLKYVVKRLKNTNEYGPEKKIEIIQENEEGHKQKFVITMQEIMENDR